MKKPADQSLAEMFFSRFTPDMIDQRIERMRLVNIWRRERVWVTKSGREVFWHGSERQAIERGWTRPEGYAKS